MKLNIDEMERMTPSLFYDLVEMESETIKAREDEQSNTNLMKGA